jgi:hypothetical protein
MYFREVKGKIVERVEIDPDLNAITILEAQAKLLRKSTNRTQGQPGR